MATITRTVKSADSLSQPRNIEKLEIERRYWTDRGAIWGVITDREIPTTLLQGVLHSR